MNFQILDADYVTEGTVPVVRLFGRAEDGKSTCCYVPGFEPYFDVNASGRRLFLIFSRAKPAVDISMTSRAPGALGMLPKKSKKPMIR